MTVPHFLKGCNVRACWYKVTQTFVFKRRASHLPETLCRQATAATEQGQCGCHCSPKGCPGQVQSTHALRSLP
eukprot:2354272-Amphidinium_carterae.1